MEWDVTPTIVGIKKLECFCYARNSTNINLEKFYNYGIRKIFCRLWSQLASRTRIKREGQPAECRQWCDVVDDRVLSVDELVVQLQN